MKKKYCVELSKEERDFLSEVIELDRAAKHKKNKARMLLQLDEGKFGPAWKDKQVSEAYGYTTQAIERLRRKFVTEGFENILEHGNNGNSFARKIYGDEEAHLIALACSDAPEGKSRWTVRLLADKMVELNYADECAKSTVNNVLKKTNLSLT